MIDKTSSTPGVRLSVNDRKRITNHIFNAVVSGVESPSVNVLRVDDLTQRAKKQGKSIRKCLKRLKNCRRTVFAEIGADYIVQSKVDQEPSSSAYQLRVELYKVGRFDGGHKQVVGAWTDTASSPRGLTAVAGFALSKIIERLRAIDRRRSGLELTDAALTAGELALKARASRLERRRVIRFEVREPGSSVYITPIEGVGERRRICVTRERSCARSLVAGRYRVEVSAAGYDDWLGTFDTESSRVVRVGQKPKFGVLSLSDVPSDIEVYVDDRRVGRTPLSESERRVLAGSYQLRLLSPCYEPWTKSVTIKRDATLSLSMTGKLRVRRGALTVEAVNESGQRADAMLTLHGRALGSASATYEVDVCAASNGVRSTSPTAYELSVTQPRLLFHIIKMELMNYCT